jgi:hypothetical protein
MSRWLTLIMLAAVFTALTLELLQRVRAHRNLAVDGSDANLMQRSARSLVRSGAASRQV